MNQFTHRTRKTTAFFLWWPPQGRWIRRIPTHRLYLLHAEAKADRDPAGVARQFAADIRAYHAEQDDNRRDRIAIGTRHMLLEHLPAGTKLRLTEVKELFELMR